MAKFDIVRSTRSVPGQGPNIHSNVRFDTGQVAVAQAAADLGGAFTEVGSDIWKIQADKEFSQATLVARRETAKMDAFMLENHDEEAIAEKRDELFDFLQSQEIKNGLAGRKYQAWLNDALPAIEKDIKAKVRAIEVDDWKAKWAQKQAEAIRTGIMSSVIAMTELGIRNGAISKEEGSAAITATRHKAEVRAAGAFAMRFPEQALDDIQGDKFENFPGLTPGEVQNFRNIAKGQIAHNKTQFDEAKEAEEQELFKLIQEPDADLPKLLAKVNSMQFQTTDEQVRWTQLMTNLMEKIHQGEPNPFKLTQNYGALTKTMLSIEAGQPMTVMDINRAWLSGPEGQPQWSIEDNNWLKRVLADRNKPSATGYTRTHPISKSYLTRLDDLYGVDEDGNLPNPDENSVPFIQDRFQLENALRDNWGNANAIDAAYKKITENVKDRNGKGLLSRIWNFLFHDPLSEKTLRKQGRAKRGDAPFVQYYPTTDEEEKAVPTGQLYIRNGQLMRRK